jgi:hypothetical protein
MLGAHGNAPLMRAMGARWQRAWETGGHATTWRDVERAPERFVFDDAAFDAAFRHVGVLDAPPSWAGEEPTLELWLRYVDRVVRRFAGRVTAWEIFNEPYRAPDRDWAKAHVARVEAIARTIRAADTNALVVSGGPPEEIQPGLDWWRVLADEGLFVPLDVVSVHLYIGGGGRKPLDADVKLHAYMSELRSLIDAHSGKGKPLWDTESGIGPNETFYIDRSLVYGFWDASGFNVHEPVPYEIGAAMAARLLLLHLWHEIRWFTYQNLPSFGNAWAAVDFDGSPLPFTVALAQLMRRFHGARPDGLPRLPSGLWGFRFRVGDDSVVAVWSIGASRVVELVRDPRVQLRDMFDNVLPPTGSRAIGAEPLLLIGTPNAIDAQLAGMRVSAPARALQVP